MKDINATIIIELNGKTEQDLFRNIEYSRRKNINKAIRSGLIIEEDNSEKCYEECYEMYAKVLVKGGSAPTAYNIWRARIEKEGQKYFRIKKDGKTIGFMSVMEITRRYYEQDSDERGVRPRVFASNPEYNEYRTNDFIYWNTILYGLRKGYNFVDLGGYQIKPKGHLINVNDFKEKWGGSIFYFKKDYPFFKAIGRKLIRNSNLFWWLYTFFKRSKLDSEIIE